MWKGTQLSIQRLHNHRLIGEPFGPVHEALGWLCAAQAQEYALAKWSLGRRTSSATESVVEQAISDGTILRTHVLRPTWHFLLPADIRWVLALTGPRVHVQNASYYRKLGLDDDTHVRSRKVITKALSGGKHLTRNQLAAALHSAGIQAEGHRLAYIVMHAELDAVICNGKRQGKQHTYALLEERVPPAAPLAREEALAQLTLRYFTSHGPATAKDFRWWSSLTAADARQGLESVKDELSHETVEGRQYWFADSSAPAQITRPVAHLLQGYDESVVGYSESRGALDLERLAADIPETHNFYVHPLLIDGQIAGMWRRILKARSATFELRLGRELLDAEWKAVHGELARFSAFEDLDASLVLV